MATIRTLFTTALALASTISAAPAPIPRGYPTTGTSFRLTAQPIGAFDLDPSVDGREVGFTVRNATSATLVLVPRPELAGAVFNAGVLNNATVSLAGGSSSSWECPRAGTRQAAAGVVVRPGGTFTIPSAGPVDLRCGNATVGVAVRPDPTAAPGSGEESLQFQAGTWMACEGSRLGLTDAVVAIGYRTPTQRPLVGCVDVRLVPTYV